MVTSEPAREKNCTVPTGPMARPATPKEMATTAPSAPPAETPSVCGVASGLRSSAWNMAPATASPPPASRPSRMRGARCASTMLTSCAGAWPPARMCSTSRAGTCTWP